MRYLMLLLVVALALPAQGYQYWNDIRHSASLPDTTVVVRVENPSGAGVDNYLLYEGSEVLETFVLRVRPAGPGWSGWRRRTGVATYIRDLRTAVADADAPGVRVRWASGPPGLPRRGPITSVGNLLLDLMIVIKTVRVVLFGKGR